MKKYTSVSSLIVIALVLFFFFSTETGTNLMDTVKNRLTRGLRNNNPGNLDRTRDKNGNVLPFGAPGYVAYTGEIAGTDSRFRTFSSLEYGYRAIFKLIQTYRTKYGLDTIREIISRYAPGNENNTEAYIKTVSSRVGVSADEPLYFTKDEYLKLVAAISRVENGIEPSYDAVNQGYNLYQS